MTTENEVLASTAEGAASTELSLVVPGTSLGETVMLSCLTFQ